MCHEVCRLDTNTHLKRENGLNNFSSRSTLCSVLQYKLNLYTSCNVNQLH
jgi:hypothetical protein